NAAFAQRRRAIHFRSHIRHQPLDCHARARLCAGANRNLKRTTRNNELISRKCGKRAIYLHSRIRANNLHGASVWALQSRINVQCISGHHITSIAPLLTFTEDVVTSTLPEPNSLTTPLVPTVCFALLLSLCMSLASVTFDPLV